MTFSIVAFDPANGDLGVAVASKFPCVGAVVPWAQARRRRRRDAGVGEHGLRPGRPAAHGGRDAGGAGARRRAGRRRRPRRAPGGLRGRRRRGGDLHGLRMRRVGGRCLGRRHFAAQGNILAGADVVDAMARAFGSADGELCDRLLTALMAGDAAGGDRRGRQSAALLVVRDRGGYEGRNDRYIDLRVDDHPDAPAELGRLFGVWDDTMLVRTDPPLEATAELVSEVQRRLASVGRYDGPAHGAFDEPTRVALAEWACVGTTSRDVCATTIASPRHLVTGAPGHHPGGVVTGRRSADGPVDELHEETGAGVRGEGERRRAGDHRDHEPAARR